MTSTKGQTQTVLYWNLLKFQLLINSLTNIGLFVAWGNIFLLFSWKLDFLMNYCWCLQNSWWWYISSTNQRASNVTKLASQPASKEKNSEKKNEYVSGCKITARAKIDCTFFKIVAHWGLGGSKLSRLQASPREDGETSGLLLNSYF